MTVRLSHCRKVREQYGYLKKMAYEMAYRNEKRPERGVFKGGLAETKGFEPLMQLFTAYSLSRGAPSASRSRLQQMLHYASKQVFTGLKARGW